MCRIAGRLGSLGVSLDGANGEIPALINGISNPRLEAGAGTGLGGQFDWGGRLPNCNGGARSSPRGGWKSSYECKGKRWIDCERDIASRCESRS